MHTYHIVRVGWNAANQSSLGRPANPKDDFESGRFVYLGTVDAISSQEAVDIAGTRWTFYNGQLAMAIRNPRNCRGLTRAIRLHKKGETP